MRLVTFGVGQAGGKILDRLLAYEDRHGADFLDGALALNTADPDLRGLERVPDERRLLVGADRVQGHGVGADNELAAEIALAERDAILAATDDVQTTGVDAFLVVAALGGGTGSGAGPVVARHLREVYDRPVYGLGILPSSDEGGVYAHNAARSLRTFVEHVDNLLLFDNDAWRSAGESVGSAHARANEELARRFGLLFSAGEVGPGDQVPESVVDASEIVQTLDCGGVSTLGYATSELSRDAGGGLAARLGFGEESVDETEAINRLTAGVRRATLGRLTAPCDVASTTRALTVAAGPPAYLNRKGIARSRQWLEDETSCMAVRGGDYPLPDADHVASLVLLAGVGRSDRVEELKAVGVQADANQTERRERDATETVVGDADEQLDDLI
jgi:cell division GTPase FtsZ